MSKDFMIIVQLYLEHALVSSATVPENLSRLLWPYSVVLLTPAIRVVDSVGLF